MLRSKVFIFFLISFFVGVFVCNILGDFRLITLFLSGVMVVLFIILCFMKKYHLFLLIISCGITFGSFYSGIYNYYIESKITYMQPYYNKQVSVIGEVKELYKKSNNSYSYIIKLQSIDDKKVGNISGLMYYSPYSTLSLGDIISFEAEFLGITDFSQEFHYQKYLQTKNIYAQFFINELNIIKMNNLPTWRQFIVDTRQSILENVYNTYPKNEAIFLAGILIGAREDMPESLRNSLNNSGLTHLVAVSGFNITIIIIFLGFLLQGLPLFLRVGIISFCLVFFVFLVGENIPVIRAGIMGWIGYIILTFGRKADSLALLLFTAFLIVLYQPLYLNYDTSFHLSFLAVLGLLYFQDFWTKIFYFLPKFFAIKESFVLTMSALTTTLPIMIFSFGQVSLFSPITNMLVGGAIPFAMLFGFLAIIAQFFSSLLGFIVGFINYFILKYIILIADFFGNLDISVFKIDFGFFGIYLEIGYFMILIYGIIYFKQKENPTQ